MLDLKLANIALQTRWLWLQRNDQNRAWSALGIQVSQVVESFFRASTVAVVGNGANVKFWLDGWINGLGVPCLAPHLLVLVPARFRNNRTVAQGLFSQRWMHDSHRYPPHPTGNPRVITTQRHTAKHPTRRRGGQIRLAVDRARRVHCTLRLSCSTSGCPRHGWCQAGRPKSRCHPSSAAAAGNPKIGAPASPPKQCRRPLATSFQRVADLQPSPLPNL